MPRSPSRSFSLFSMGPRKRARREPAAESPTTPADTPGSAAAPPGESFNSSASSTPRPRPGPTGITPSTTASSSALSNATTTVPPTGPGVIASSPVVNTLRTSDQVRKTRSWYGSWPQGSKSSASVPEVARESIMGGTAKPEDAPDFARFQQKAPDRRDAEDSHIGQDGADLMVSKSNKVGDEAPPAKTSSAEHVDQNPIETDRPASGIIDTKIPENDAIGNSARPSSGWFGWLAKKPTTSPEDAAVSTLGSERAKAEAPSQKIPLELPADGKQISTPQDISRDQLAVPSTNDIKTDEKEPPPLHSGSWFPFWSSKPPKLLEAGDEGPRSMLESQEQRDVLMEDAPPVPEPPPRPAPSAGSTWAFWSRESKSKSKGKDYCPSEPGELAVMGEGSEEHPTPAKAIDVEAKHPSLEQTQPKSSPSRLSFTSRKKGKRARPQSIDDRDPVPDSPTTPVAAASKPAPTSKNKAAKSAATAYDIAPNLLLPSFHSTYQMKENPSIIRQITEFLLRTQQPPTNHVFRRKDVPKLKKALSIGVHGLFPASYLRPMIGQPTGTSIKFANQGAEAIRRWAEANAHEDVEIEKVALEGEGKIADRVDNLWRLLLNWIDHIREADFIMLCCHSQGVPVTIMLVAKLIDLGIVTSAKIGVCAMAGVSLGPFPDYKSGMGMLMGTAAELWQFSNPESEISQRYEHSLKEALAYGVRITYIGSIDDQLVPMESAVHSPAAHPYIYRAVFIDGRLHAPDFIAHLVGFALKLRNLGVSDHGLIRELSVPLAGSLYGGEGHSRLYDDGQVYDLAVSHALETTDVKQVECQVRKHEGITNPNPYHLPWIMRGLLEEDFVKTELTAETSELLRQFDDWKPTNKALKDVKYRLEAVRSKL